MLTGALAAILLTSTASAHPYDYWSGKYIGKDNAEILLRIDTSAQTSFLTWGDVYQYGYDWNNISSKVKVSLALAGSGTPSLYGAMGVIGKWYDNGKLGETIPYDSNGNPMEIAEDIYDVNANWAGVIIYMNTNPIAFSSDGKLTNGARKTFLHEVGHALKLSHPLTNSSISGHIKSGRPVAVMNYGYPDRDSGGGVSPTITDHDKSCLKTKWGA